MSLKKLRLSKENILLALISLSALAFRVTNLGLIEFKTDEATNLFLAAQPLFGHPFSPGGTVSSLGILNPPIFNYFIFLIANFTFDPRIISFFIAFANSVAIVGLFILIKKYYSTLTAVITTLLLSFSPWAILYSRKIWMQDLLLPFVVILLYCVHKLINKQSANYSFLYSLSAMILIQLHQISIVFVLVLSSFIILKKIKIDWKYFSLGFLLGLLPTFPYIFYEVKNNFPDFFALLASRGKLNSTYSFDNFLRPLQIVNIGDFRFVLGDDTLTFAEKFPLIYKARQLLYVEYLLLPMGLFLFVKNNKKYAFLGYCTIATVLIYFVLKVETFMHYFIIITPLLFLFLATAIVYMIKNKIRALRYLGFIVFAAIIISSFLFDKAFFDLLNFRHGLKGDYGTAYSYQDNNALKILTSDSTTQKEKLLASYIPLDYMFGYEPLGKILYGNLSEQNLPLLDAKLKKDPENKLTQFPILAVYTKQKETPATVSALRLKSSENILYLPIYNTAYNHYLSANYKKEYVSSSRSFFYPEHWKAESKGGSVILTGDGYQVVINNLDNNKITFTCVDLTNKCNKITIEEIKNSVIPIY